MQHGWKLIYDKYSPSPSFLYLLLSLETYEARFTFTRSFTKENQLPQSGVITLHPGLYCSCLIFFHLHLTIPLSSCHKPYLSFVRNTIETTLANSTNDNQTHLVPILSYSNSTFSIPSSRYKVHL